MIVLKLFKKKKIRTTTIEREELPPLGATNSFSTRQLFIDTCSVPCIVAGTGNVAITGQVCPVCRAYISVGMTNYKQTSQILSDRITTLKEQDPLDQRMM